MNVRQEINMYAKEEDKLILNWLLDHYSWESQWTFVAGSLPANFRSQHGNYHTHRVWSPTTEGRQLYAVAKMLQALRPKSQDPGENSLQLQIDAHGIGQEQGVKDEMERIVNLFLGKGLTAPYAPNELVLCRWFNDRFDPLNHEEDIRKALKGESNEK